MTSQNWKLTDGETVGCSPRQPAVRAAPGVSNSPFQSASETRDAIMEIGLHRV
jgi:hypothetical protein